ncbi:MAG TPA: hypothetical protein VFQ53_21340 [Kofleriaceae bacterium]|nr:hypothetical protein [Kofleriaceae bacterium]
MLLFGGCADDDDDSTPTPTGILTPPAAGEGIQLSLVHSLSPGEEIHWCRYVVLDEALDVSRFEHAYTQGSHHVIAYTTPFTAATVPSADDFNCEAGAGETFNGVAYVGGVPTGELAFPAGVGFHFNAGAVVLLEAHYLNPTDAPLDAEAAINFYNAAQPPTEQAGTLFLFDPGILVPANGTFTAQMTCEVPHDIHVVSLLSHMHSRGIHYEAKATSASSSIPLLDTDQWLDPEPTVLSEPLTLSTGTRFEFSCDYRDTTGMTVVDGPSKDHDEMCMLIGTYWPRMDFVHEQCLAPGSGPVFSGTQTCAQSLACIQSASDPIAAKQCAVNTCNDSSTALDDYQNCVFLRCINPGTCSGPDCGACAAASCGAEFQRCEAATCGS